MNEIQILIITISVISLFVVGIPLMYGLLLPVFKPKISKNANKYLYAFSSGFFLIMATVLFIGESKIELEEYFKTVLTNNEIGSKAITGLIIGGVILVGLLVSLGLKYLFASKSSNALEHNHDHDNLIFNLNDHNPKSKAFAIFFLLSHRIPDGLIIGTLCSQIAKDGNGVNITNIVFLCSFIIHIIPEELIIYYRQIDMGISKKKATLNSLIAIASIIPLIIIGAIISWFSQANQVAIAIIQLVSASFLLFISIVEFIPEFIHDLKNNGKAWYLIILIWIIGVVIGLFVISLHSHGHDHGSSTMFVQNQLLNQLNQLII